MATDCSNASSKSVKTLGGLTSIPMFCAVSFSRMKAAVLYASRLLLKGTKMFLDFRQNGTHVYFFLDQINEY